MALSSAHLAALIDLRVAELRVLAAQTALEYGQTRPTLAERYFPALQRTMRFPFPVDIDRHRRVIHMLSKR
jgi:hypothetical protein